MNGFAAPAYPYTYTNIPSGSVVRLVAAPAASYVFAGWTGSFTGVANPVDISHSCIQTMTAVFVPGAGGISGSAWHDENRDGIQDPVEEGIPGIRVTAFGIAGPAGAADTDGNGGYRIAVAEPGDYSVAFTVPAGAALTPAWYGVDPALDSDADPATGRTRNVSITAEDPYVLLSAGFANAPTPAESAPLALPLSKSKSGGGGCFIASM